VAIAAEGFVALYPVVEDDTLRAAEADYFRGLVERVRAACPGPAVTSQVIELDADGDVADTLARYAGTTGAETVVMTTHGRGPFTRFWLGSTADEFVRQSPVPVLLLRPASGAPVDLAHKPHVRHILVPLDGSDLAERVIPPVSRFGRLVGGEYTLLTVFEPSHRGEALPGLEPYRMPEGWDPDPALGRAQGYLDGVAKGLRDVGATVHTKLVTHGSPVEAILDFAQAHPDTVVALATHGRSGLTRLLLGSVADKVIRAAVGPVLVYRPTDGTPV
jgi:nucleotide-binding universal stress UspA family protein